MSGVWCSVKNNLRYISINQLFHQLGETLCKALSSYYAFTGCDYTSLFNTKGKIKPFKLLKKNPELQEAFLNLSHSEGMSDDIKSITKSFVCQSNVWKKEDKLSQSSMPRDLCYQVQTEKIIYFSQPNSSKDVGFKHNAVFQSLTSKDQVIYLCCKYLDELT